MTSKANLLRFTFEWVDPVLGVEGTETVEDIDIATALTKLHKKYPGRQWPAVTIHHESSLDGA